MISIHAPRVGSDSLHVSPFLRLTISIHAPRVGSDLIDAPKLFSSCYFNPRSPRGERRSANDMALLCSYFNPRSPRGERPCIRLTSCLTSCLFQSTLPAWGATALFVQPCDTAAISIHAPRVGSDISNFSFSSLVTFQSTLPAWGATTFHSNLLNRVKFQSTLPAWGATRASLIHSATVSNFNPRSPRGERRS